MNIETPAEAFAAIAAVVIGADGIGTDAERRYLLEELPRFDVFEDMDAGSFDVLIRTVCDTVWTTLPNDGSRITAEGLEMLIDACRDVLGPDQLVEACGMAESLADVDERSAEELEVILVLRQGFGVPEA